MKMELDGLWRIHRGAPVCLLMVITWFCVQSLIAVSLNDEGMALLRFKDRIENDPFGALLAWKESSLENDHCSWFGVDCVDGHIVSLKLKDLCIVGMLAPELGHLVHLKLIVLRNNSLSGVIPEELAGLKELEVLDLGFNNFSGPLPHEWGNNVAVLLLDNNGLFCHVTPEVEQLMMLSEVQVEESDLSPISEDSTNNVKFKPSCVAEHAKALSRAFTRFDHQTKDPIHRRELANSATDPPPPTVNTVLDPNAPPPSSSSSPPGQAPPSPNEISGPTVDPNAPPPTPPPPSSSPPQHPPPPSGPTPPGDNPTETPPPPSGKGTKVVIAISASAGVFILLALIIGLFIWKHKKIATVGPWRTGMTGRTQRSDANGDDKRQILSRDIADTGLTQGIANLQRSELEAACEEFSNVIGSSSIGTLYKGTLSSGGEIAVLTYAVKHPQEWSDHMQTLFKKKVDMLTKVSHKNFLNLIGYCEEEKPFTRMLVFEYAPSGTLFEHLYVRESEHLDWTMRLRIVMGITYCLEHMHTLTPSITHEDLTAYAVNLSEDYAAKLSAFGIWNEVALAARPLPVVIKTATSPETNPEDNVYSFGLLLLETMTGKAPHSMGSTSSLDKWASDFLRGEKPLKDFVDPMLRHVDTAQLEKISEMIKSCTLPYPNERPRMEDVALSLTEVTGVAPNRAAPRLSPWWPDIESQSSRSQTVASDQP